MARTRELDELGLLTAVHVAAFLLALILAFTLPEIGVFLFVPLVVAQSGLLTTWFVLGGGRFEDRLGLWLGATFFMGLPTMCLVFPLAGLHAAVLAVLRRKLAGLYLFIGDESAFAHRRLQFTIKHLLILTLLVAMALAGARALRAMSLERMTGAEPLAFLLAPLAAAIASQLFALWAVLGTERPAVGVTGAVLVAAALGGLLAYAVNAGTEAYLIFPPVAAAQGAVYALSLLAHRSAGYRLFAHPPRAIFEEAEGAICFLEPDAEEEERESVRRGERETGRGGDGETAC